MSEPKLTVAICTYNRADKLPALIGALRRQECPVSFELLVINNNSRDDTLAVLAGLAKEPGVPLRFVTEVEQGISAARNRAIAEAMHAEYLVFIDDDELPMESFLAAAHEGLRKLSCVGGRILVDLPAEQWPRWLEENLLGFLGKVDHGNQPLVLEDESRPIWSGNIAYRMEVFRDAPDLRFDSRYSRKGAGVGGGEDVVMFRRFLERNIPMGYSPEMAVRHLVEPWKLQRRYFLRLHFACGYKEGRWEMEPFPRSFFGVPLFLFTQFAVQLWRTIKTGIAGGGGTIRQAMNAAHALGFIVGTHAAWRAERPKGAAAAVNP